MSTYYLIIISTCYTLMEISVIVINKLMRSSWYCVNVYLFQQDIRGKTTVTVGS